MDFNYVITAVMLVFFAVGAVDYILDGRFGLSEEFKKGMLVCGRLLLNMGGFMVLAPLLAQILGPVVTPFFRAIHADPSVLAGMLLANDAGGAVMAMELADSVQAGQFNGLIVGSMFGTTIMLCIPTIMSVTAKEDRSSAIYGILCGFVGIPVGCLAGGFAAGFSAELILFNTLPILVLSGVLLAGLLLLQDRIVPAFSIFAKFLTCLSVFGLTCGAADSLLGIKLLPNAGSLEHVFPVVGRISLYLAGALVLLTIFQRIFAAPLEAIGRKLAINTTSVSALVLTLANPLPSILMNRDMDAKGRMLNIAFVATAGCIIGDHLAYTSQVAPELCAPVVIGKAVAGATALGVALFLAPKLLAAQQELPKSV